MPIIPRMLLLSRGRLKFKVSQLLKEMVKHFISVHTIKFLLMDSLMDYIFAHTSRTTTMLGQRKIIVIRKKIHLKMHPQPIRNN